MTKKHEELVEEIGNIVCPGCVLFNPHKQRCRHIYWASLKEAREKCTTLSKILPLVFSAFRDGRLDEELGVVARGEVENGVVMAWYHAHDKPGPQQGIHYPIIALRPPTGKEETLEEIMEIWGDEMIDAEIERQFPAGTGKEEE